MKKDPTYNYRNVFNEPIKIKQLTNNVSLPYFIKLRDIGIYVVTLLLLFLFCHQFVSFINQYISIFGIAFYLGVPYLVVRVIEHLHPDGKNIMWFLLDYIKYFFNYRLKHQKVCHDVATNYIDQKYVFEPFNYKSKEKENHGKNC